MACQQTVTLDYTIAGQTWMRMLRSILHPCDSHLLLALPQQSVDLKSLVETSEQSTSGATNQLKMHPAPITK